MSYFVYSCCSKIYTQTEPTAHAEYLVTRMGELAVNYGSCMYILLLSWQGGRG